MEKQKEIVEILYRFGSSNSDQFIFTYDKTALEEKRPLNSSTILKIIESNHPSIKNYSPNIKFKHNGIFFLLSDNSDVPISFQMEFLITFPLINDYQKIKRLENSHWLSIKNSKDEEKFYKNTKELLKAFYAEFLPDRLDTFESEIDNSLFETPKEKISSTILPKAKTKSDLFHSIQKKYALYFLFSHPLHTSGDFVPVFYEKDYLNILKIITEADTKHIDWEFQPLRKTDFKNIKTDYLIILAHFIIGDDDNVYLQGENSKDFEEEFFDFKEVLKNSSNKIDNLIISGANSHAALKILKDEGIENIISVERNSFFDEMLAQSFLANFIEKIIKGESIESACKKSEVEATEKMFKEWGKNPCVKYKFCCCCHSHDKSCKWNNKYTNSHFAQIEKHLSHYLFEKNIHEVIDLEKAAKTCCGTPYFDIHNKNCNVYKEFCQNYHNNSTENESLAQEGILCCCKNEDYHKNPNKIVSQIKEPKKELHFPQLSMHLSITNKINKIKDTCLRAIGREEDLKFFLNAILKLTNKNNLNLKIILISDKKEGCTTFLKKLVHFIKFRKSIFKVLKIRYTDKKSEEEWIKFLKKAESNNKLLLLIIDISLNNETEENEIKKDLERLNIKNFILVSNSKTRNKPSGCVEYELKPLSEDFIKLRIFEKWLENPNKNKNEILSLVIWHYNIRIEYNKHLADKLINQNLKPFPFTSKFVQDKPLLLFSCVHKLGIYQFMLEESWFKKYVTMDDLTENPYLPRDKHNFLNSMENKKAIFLKHDDQNFNRFQIFERIEHTKNYIIYYWYLKILVNVSIYVINLLYCKSNWRNISKAIELDSSEDYFEKKKEESLNPSICKINESIYYGPTFKKLSLNNCLEFDAFETAHLIYSSNVYAQNTFELTPTNLTLFYNYCLSVLKYVSLSELAQIINALISDQNWKKEDSIECTKEDLKKNCFIILTAKEMIGDLNKFNLNLEELSKIFHEENAEIQLILKQMVTFDSESICYFLKKFEKLELKYAQPHLYENSELITKYKALGTKIKSSGKKNLKYLRGRIKFRIISLLIGDAMLSNIGLSINSETNFYQSFDIDFNDIQKIMQIFQRYDALYLSLHCKYYLGFVKIKSDINEKKKHCARIGEGIKDIKYVQNFIKDQKLNSVFCFENSIKDPNSMHCFKYLLELCNKTLTEVEEFISNRVVVLSYYPTNASLESLFRTKNLKNKIKNKLKKQNVIVDFLTRELFDGYIGGKYVCNILVLNFKFINSTHHQFVNKSTPFSFVTSPISDYYWDKFENIEHAHLKTIIINFPICPQIRKNRESFQINGKYNFIFVKSYWEKNLTLGEALQENESNYSMMIGENDNNIFLRYVYELLKYIDSIDIEEDIVSIHNKIVDLMKIEKECYIFDILPSELNRITQPILQKSETIVSKLFHNISEFDIKSTKISKKMAQFLSVLSQNKVNVVNCIPQIFDALHLGEICQYIYDILYIEFKKEINFLEFKNGIYYLNVLKELDNIPKKNTLILLKIKNAVDLLLVDNYQDYNFLIFTENNTTKFPIVNYQKLEKIRKWAIKIHQQAASPVSPQRSISSYR